MIDELMKHLTDKNKYLVRELIYVIEANKLRTIEDLIQFEKDFGYTLKRDTDLETLIRKGVPYETISKELAAIATSYEYKNDIIVPEQEKWQIPSGAFKKCGGAI